MKYSKCLCKTRLHTADLADYLDGLQGEEFKNSLADIIGGYCMFESDSHFGRAYKNRESAEKGNQVFDYSAHGDDWDFTATIICLDYEDEINCEFLPFFELSETTITVIKSRISEYLGIERVKKHFPAAMAKRIADRKKRNYTVWGATYEEFNHSDGIPALVKADLENAITDIFVKWQNALNIESGDCGLLAELELDKRKEELAEVMTRILKAQFENALESEQ